MMLIMDSDKNQYKFTSSTDVKNVFVKFFVYITLLMILQIHFLASLAELIVKPLKALEREVAILN